VSAHGRTQLPKKHVFRVARFLSRPLTNIQRSLARAPRSRNAATLPTHQVVSRHAGCATPGAFRHRKHAHERRARARLCQLIKTLGDTLARREVVLSCPCAPGAGAAVASMGWQSRLSSAVAVTTRPTALCQDVPGLLAAVAAASIGRQSTGCCM
jgi:hypothetical protein